MITDRLVQLIKFHEGLRLNMYRCPDGRLTIGYGHNLEASPITEQVAEQILIDDLAEAISAARRIYGVEFDRFGEVRQSALVDMVINMGEAGVRGFVKTNRLILARQWTAAGKEARRSEWWRQDVPRRAERICRMIESGVWPKDVAED